jgi:membrane dipeptidase
MHAADAEWARLGLPAYGEDWPRGPLPGEDPADVPVVPLHDFAVEPAFAPWLAANPKPSATLAQVADHVEHAREVAGIDHVGIGGDFDGTPEVPDGLADVSCYPRLFEELRTRGWSDRDLEQLANRNILRALRDAEEQAEEPLWPR